MFFHVLPYLLVSSEIIIGFIRKYTKNLLADLILIGLNSLLPRLVSMDESERVTASFPHAFSGNFIGGCAIKTFGYNKIPAFLLRGGSSIF